MLGALEDATGDLAAANDTAGFTRGAALAGAVRSLHTKQAGVSAFERLQMLPLAVTETA